MSSYFYGCDNSIIAKNVNGKPKLLTREDVKNLLDQNVCKGLIDSDYFEVDCSKKCCDCNNEAEFISLSSVFVDVIDYYPIRSFCFDCYCDYV